MNRYIVKGLLPLLLFAFLAGCGSGSRVQQNSSPSKRNSRTSDSLSVSTKARQFFLQGSVLEMQERFAEAIVEYQQALRYDSSAVILNALARNYFELSQFSETSKLEIALDYAEAAVRADSAFVPAWETLAGVYLRQFRYDEAISVLERLAVLEPNTGHLYSLARIYELKNTPKAIETYERILKTEDDPSILLRLSNLYLEQNRQSDYIRTLEKMFAQTPENLPLAEILIQAYSNQQEYLKAEKLLDEIRGNISNDELKRFYYIYGIKLISLNDSLAGAATRRHIEKISAFSPPSWELLMLASSLSEKTGDSAAIDSYLERALTLNDSNPEVRINAAVSYMQRRKFAKALTIVKDAEKIFPDERKFYFIEGILYSSLDSHRAAIAPLQKALDMEPKDIDVWVQLGIAYDQLKSENPSFSDSSDAAYEKALELDPDQALANNNYAYSLSLRKKNLSKAKRMAQAALAADPDNSSYLDTYGWVLYQLGDYENALDYLSRAVETGGASATELEHLGDAYHELGQTDKARESWNKALDKDPGKKNILEKLKNVR